MCSKRSRLNSVRCSLSNPVRNKFLTGSNRVKISVVFLFVFVFSSGLFLPFFIPLENPPFLTGFIFGQISQQEQVGVNGVIPICDNNGICEPEMEESYDNCPTDCPSPVVPFPGASLPDTAPPVIYNLYISKITLNSATIEWKTNEQALCQLFWGKTSKYKEGSISENTFYFKHSIELTDLLSATIYHFKVICRDTNRNESEVKDQKFITLTLPDIAAPTNASNFEAIPGDSQITLKWQNPPEPDFKAIKIMRGEKFYPSNPWEGRVIYDGRGDLFVDIGLTNGNRYYYTAFTYDYTGNYSSGAIVSAVPRPVLPPPSEEIFTEKECIKAGYFWYDGACHPEPKVISLPPEVEKLTLKDFDFWQEDKKIPLIEEFKIKIETEKPLTISIDYQKVPEVLKTIMVILEKEGKPFSFLLRANKEKTRYEAIILPPEPGIYPITLLLLDYKNQIFKKIFGQFEVFEPISPIVPISWYKKYEPFLSLLFLSLIILILLIGIGYSLYQKYKK